ncbi:MAG: hypothetical protein AAGA96_07290 [Verrucomicrobiota bacterium]
MSIAKSLSKDQIKTIQSWADGGDGLSEIQQKLGSELEVKVTYLETRFLLEDLKIELQPEPEPEVEEETEDVEETAEADLAGEDPLGDPDSLGAGSVSITMDTVQRPGAIVSGRATFAGGEGAAWWLDQMGRLGMDPDNKEFKPTESQLMDFQQELQKAVQQGGL